MGLRAPSQARPERMVLLTGYHRDKILLARPVAKDYIRRFKRHRPIGQTVSSFVRPLVTSYSR